MKALRALLAGIVGALAMSAAMFLIRELGENISLEVLLGSTLTGVTSLPPWLSGFILHLVIGGLMGLVYAITFEIVESSGPMTGGGLGLAHGLIAGLFMSSITAMNPLSLGFSSPGPFLTHMSFGPAIFLVVHFIYGVTVGLVYGRPLHRPQLRPRHIV
jgi:hypothetical protein